VKTYHSHQHLTKTMVHQHNIWSHHLKKSPSLYGVNQMSEGKIFLTKRSATSWRFEQQQTCFLFTQFKMVETNFIKSKSNGLQILDMCCYK